MGPMTPLEAGKETGAWSLRRLLSKPMRWLARATRELAAEPAEAAPAPGSALKDKRVREVIQPRTNVVSLNVDASEEEVRQLVRAERYSRYPVHRDSLDDVIGVFLAKDLWLH